MTDSQGLGKGLMDLASLLNRPEVNAIWYNKKEVKLDGYKFIGCRFDGCTLTVTSSNFELESCFIDSSTVIKFGGDIVKPIKLFNSRSEWAYEKSPFFAPIKNADGTITIKA